MNDQQFSNAYWRLWVESHPDHRFRYWPTTAQVRAAIEGAQQ